jgi:hypothetical protein
MIQGIGWAIVGEESGSRAWLTEFALHALYGGHRLWSTIPVLFVKVAPALKIRLGANYGVRFGGCPSYDKNISR